MSRILLLEADKLMAENIKAGLRLVGRVDWQVEPQAAMDSADAKAPDLVIIDLALAGRSGIEFLYEFRSYPEWDEVPVIVYSSVSETEIADSLPSIEHLNINKFLYKPDTPLKKLAEEASQCLRSRKPA